MFHFYLLGSCVALGFLRFRSSFCMHIIHRRRRQKLLLSHGAFFVSNRSVRSCGCAIHRVQATERPGGRCWPECNFCNPRHWKAWRLTETSKLFPQGHGHGWRARQGCGDPPIRSRCGHSPPLYYHQRGIPARRALRRGAPVGGHDRYRGRGGAQDGSEGNGECRPLI